MIGQMRQRVKIQVIGYVDDGAGGSTETWTDELTTWAQVEPLRSSKLLEANQIDMRNVFQITLRWASGRIIDKKRQIIYNNEALKINGVVVLDERKRYYQLTCIRTK